MSELKAPTESRKLSETLDEVIERRVAFLSDYQNARYARRYGSLVERVRAAEEKAVPGSTALTDAVARSLFKLMAYKDEYEVARLYTNGHFEKQVGIRPSRARTCVTSSTSRRRSSPRRIRSRACRAR